VFVSVETSREYGRGLLRGIYRYSSLHRQWRIELAPCGMRDTSYAGGSRDARRTTHNEQFPRDADGVIMRDHRGSVALLKRGIPIVFASYLHKDIRGGSRIVTDDQAIGRMGAEHLLERGFRHFAFVGYDGMYWSRQREDSFVQAIAGAGRTCSVFQQAPDLRLRAWRNEQKVLADWLHGLARPLGLMACNDDRARQAADACARAGLDVPEDVAVLGVDNDEFVCNLSNPSTSSIALGLEDAGYQAAAALDQLMRAGTRTRTDKHGPARTAATVGDRVGPCLSVRPIAVVTRRSTDISIIEDPLVAQAVRFIRTNCRRPIQIADVLREVAISRRSLLDRFKRALGCTVHQYIKRARVAQIEELLLGTADPVDRIAGILGFPSAEHVALYFRSVTGMNPRAFRTQCARCGPIARITDPMPGRAGGRTGKSGIGP
jgi:LacI family transcriptional regulator